MNPSPLATNCSTQDLPKGWSFYQKFKALIPGGCGTLSKAPRLFPDEPALLESAEGCRIHDVDGNEYIDFRCALGPVTLGYKFPAVDNAIRQQLERGIVFGQPTRLEFELAEALIAAIPCAEAVRYLKTGGEAMAAAIRLARAWTNKSIIISCGYHGWINATNGKGHLPGTVEHQLTYTYGDLDTVRNLLERNKGQVAAVTLAAAYGTMYPEDPFPRQLRELATEHNVLLLVDEIVTGFRLRIGGWHEYYNVIPDLAVFSKGMANGMPLSVIAGRRDILEQTATQSIVSSTFSGETLSIAVAKTVLQVYQQQDVISHLWEAGEFFMNKANQIFKKHQIPVQFQGLPPCPLLEFRAGSAEQNVRWQNAFFRAMFRNGISMYLVCYINFSHQISDLETALQRIDTACREIDPDRETDSGPQAPRIGVLANSGTTSSTDR